MDNNITPTTPRWVHRFRQAFGSAQAFILHMNVRDYVEPGIGLTTYLTKLFASWDIVAIYNRSQGIRFPLATMEDKAKETLSLNQPQPANPLAALGIGPAAPQPAAFEWPRQPAQALPMLERLLRESGYRVAVIVEFAETIMPAADITMMPPDDRTALVTLARWGTDPEIANRGNAAILLTQNLADLHPMLRNAASLYTAIEIPIPDLETRANYIAWCADTRGVTMTLECQDMARMTAGLSLIHIENIFMQAEINGSLTPDLVRSLKTSLMETEYAGLLEVLEPSYGFDAIGGMNLLKNWAEWEIIQPARAGRLLDMPQGVLLVGPPGTGKTFFVKGLAKEIGFNAVALSMENILGGYVGTSERNLAKALAVVRSLSPVLVFMDELDQSDVSSRGQGSGNPVAKNLFNMLLRFLSDPTNRGKVIFFGASNRPDLMDAAFMRFGRIDAIIPVLLPEEPDRALIARAAAKGQGIGLEPDTAAYIAAKTPKYSGADIAAVVTKARKLSRNAGHATITLAAATHALNTLRPTTLKNADYFTLLAVETCNDTDLLPPAFASLLDDRTSLERNLEAAAPTPRKRREL